MFVITFEIGLSGFSSVSIGSCLLGCIHYYVRFFGDSFCGFIIKGKDFVFSDLGKKHALLLIEFRERSPEQLHFNFCRFPGFWL